MVDGVEVVAFAGVDGQRPVGYPIDDQLHESKRGALVCVAVPGVDRDVHVFHCEPPRFVQNAVLVGAGRLAVGSGQDSHPVGPRPLVGLPVTFGGTTEHLLEEAARVADPAACPLLEPCTVLGQDLFGLHPVKLDRGAPLFVDQVIE